MAVRVPAASGGHIPGQGGSREAAGEEGGGGQEVRGREEGRGRPAMSPRAKVMIVDDEEAIRSSLRMIFEYEGYECLLAANGQAGLKMAEREMPDLVFL